jgi:hypothetical protein
MRRLFTGMFIAAMAVSSVGCSYGAIASHDGKLYVARNDGFLFGALRKLYECTPGAGSLTCVEVKGKP